MRARVVKRKRRPTFSETLEEKARRVVGEPGQHASSITNTLREQIALTLDQLDRTRDLHGRIRRNLLRVECYIDTEIIQISPREPVYIDERWHDRQALKRQLMFLDQERRRFALAEEERLQELHHRLLTLWSRYRQLSQRE